jgi:co-chaperonin GroES (HSP10)
MRVQGKALLVMPEDNPEKTDKGILIPDAAEKPNIGRVQECGAGCEFVKPNDRIQYNRKAASVLEVEGEIYHFIIEDQVFFVYD